MIDYFYQLTIGDLYAQNDYPSTWRQDTEGN